MTTPTDENHADQEVKRLDRGVFCRNPTLNHMKILDFTLFNPTYYSYLQRKLR